ncbi:MAG: ferritin-like domain-containing protein [Pseudonocardia sp.]
MSRPFTDLVADADTAAALQTALGVEHAAVWCYGLVTAFLPTALDQRARADATAHRARRDATSRSLAGAQRRPVAAEPAYATPVPVVDQASAVALLAAVEADTAAAWRSVLERCDDPGLRLVALDALTDAAVRGARWAGEAGTRPPVPPFPGAA